MAGASAGTAVVIISTSSMTCQLRTVATISLERPVAGATEASEQ